MNSIIGIKPMKSSEVVNIYLVLEGHEPHGMPFMQMLDKTLMKPARLRELLENYHFYFTHVGDSDRFIINRQNNDNGCLFSVVDSIEKRAIKIALVKFTPFFILGLLLASSTIGFMLSAVVNKHGGYF